MNARRGLSALCALLACACAGAGDLVPSEFAAPARPKPAADAAAIRAWAALAGQQNQISVSQDGTANSAKLLQTGLDNQAFVQQLGQQNEVTIVQAGQGNRASIEQHGVLNSGRIEQVGQQGAARITQYGNGKTATIIQH